MTIRLFFLSLFSLITTPLLAQNIPLHLLKLPAGFKIEVYAQGIPGARQLAIGDKGTVFVGTKGNSVYAITKTPTVKIITIAKNLNQPNGVAFYNGALYVSEINRILRYDNIENRLSNPPTPVIVKNDLPKDTWHGLRYIRFGYDKKLYIGIGAPCNVCLPTGIFGTIMRMNPDGSQFENYAKGVRDSLGLDWHPDTKQMWFTDNGRDYMGDNLPPEKLNFAPNKGMHFGFPYHHGKGVPDPQYGSRFPESNFTMPALALPAHVAVLGMKFYLGTQFPTPAGSRQLFIAEHGSWNSSKKVGYQVVRVWINGEKVAKWEPFVTGWLQGDKAWGRPVDVADLKDGSLLISDDVGNAIYRVTYQK